MKKKGCQISEKCRFFPLSKAQLKLKKVVIEKLKILDQIKSDNPDTLYRNIRSFLDFFECFNVGPKLLIPLAEERFWIKYLEQHSQILSLEYKGGENPQKKQPGFLPLCQLLGMYYFAVGREEQAPIAFNPKLRWQDILGNRNLHSALIYQSFHAIRYIYKHYLDFIDESESALTKSEVQEMYLLFSKYLDNAAKFNVLPISLLRAELNLVTFTGMERFGLNFVPDDPDNDTPFMTSLIIGALQSLLLADHLMQSVNEKPNSKKALFFKAQMFNAYGVEELTYETPDIFLVSLPSELVEIDPVTDYLAAVKDIASRFCEEPVGLRQSIEKQANEIFQKIEAIDLTPNPIAAQSSVGEKLLPHILALDQYTVDNMLDNLTIKGIASSKSAGELGK